MLAVERMQEILHWLRERRVATVEELAEKFDVSGATIRRDLERMERNGLLQRTHGGAVLMDRTRHFCCVRPNPARRKSALPGRH